MARVTELMGGRRELVEEIVKRRKLKHFGHQVRQEAMAKVMIEGKIEGQRRRGRPPRQWEDDLKEWSGVEWRLDDGKVEKSSKGEGRVEDGFAGLRASTALTAMTQTKRRRKNLPTELSRHKDDIRMTRMPTIIMMIIIMKVIFHIIKVHFDIS